MNRRVSAVSNARDIVTKDTDAAKVITAIKAGRWSAQVAEIRADYTNALGEAGGQKSDAKRAVDSLKKALSGILWSGVFTRRGGEHLTQHSGLLCADIDDLDEDFLPEVRAELENDPHVFSVFLSPTGSGLKVVFRVPADESLHGVSFFAVRDHISDLCGVAIDESCKDVARLCFVSHDPDAYLNTDAIELVLPSHAQTAVSPVSTPVDRSARQRIAVDLLGDISWTDESGGFCQCPGQAQHTTENGERDCEVHLDGVPTIHCFHDSCRPVVDAVNHGLRSRIGREEAKRFRPNSPEVEPPPGSCETKTTSPIVGSWPEVVTTSELLDALTGEIRRYCVLPEHGDVIAALWAMWTYVFNEFSTAPMLRVTSPTKRCGKTTLLDFMARVCHEALPASNCSPAALYRVIERDQPTLLLDEADTFFRNNPELVGIINSGHTKSAAYVIRMVGEGKNMEPRQFSTWSPKLIAGIGRVTDTIEDRSLVLELKRKQSSKRLARVSRFDASELRAKLVRWSADMAEQLRADQSDFADLDNDRANDNWQPLIAIAQTAGDEWHRKAVAAAHASVRASGEGEDSIAIQLLIDLKGIFDECINDRMASAEIANKLHSLEGRPWIEFGRKQREITPNQIAQLLRPFNIRPRTMKIDRKGCKGYFKDDFTEAFALYVPSSPPSNRNPETDPEKTGVNAHIEPLPEPTQLRLENCDSARKNRQSNGVTVEPLVAEMEEAVHV